ncbi:MAG: hypothetical protein A2199_10515 [Hydrogenophilales bacterium RIFOXYA1_FULL_63_33]|nr:MAG: hypothetical protein A2199_10515 [Hydrogenophilales bacterium RIFOXYA1_FULL_63_33]
MKIAASILAATTLAIVSITHALAEVPEAERSQPQPTTMNDAYTPGLGDFMGQIQMRHAKLWFAGKAKNWQLAAYELDEIKEAFEDVAKYQPNFKGRPIAEMIGPVTAQPIAQLEKAIDAKNPVRFAKAFDRLSNACTSCHQAAGYGFIAIQRPSFPPLTNQRFEPKR